MTARTSRAAAGFTLLEVAIALAIVGVGVVTILEIFSAALKMEVGAGTRARAVVYARSVLDKALTAPELQPGTENGGWEDGYRWEARVREAPEAIGRDDREFDLETELTMYEIEISVLWPQSADRDGVYTIRTLRLAPTPTS
jgi:general secretion pathway protein I